MAYVERVNLAMDYVLSHLGEPLRLEDVSRAALLSPFHFHRVFQSLVGVTLADFVKRLRLEKALFLMAHSRKSSLTEIALACGFASSSDFSRCFKQRFGVPPSAFDLNQWRDANRAELVATLPESVKRLHIDGLPARQNPDGFKVRIRDLPARTVAYIRVRNPYRGNAVAKLPPCASSTGPNASHWQTASGSGTSGTTRRSFRSRTVSITLPSKPKGSSGRARSAGFDFRRWRSPKSKCAARSILSFAHFSGCSGPGFRGASTCPMITLALRPGSGVRSRTGWSISSCGRNCRSGRVRRSEGWRGVFLHTIRWDIV